jgi:lipoate-protein ligase A
MLCIANEITDPYFNIASEEHLLKKFSEDIFMLYVNTPSIIIGKHQNAFAEINHTFVHENKIPVIRRLSGGGTVFHDNGNLNFCFIRNGQEGNLIDFKKFTQPILDVLQNHGVPAEQSGRNDLIVEGLKFSGNAEHVYKKRTLHHGTLLFSSKLNDLGAALKSNSDHYQDKAVKSVRSKVTNLQRFLPPSINLEKLKALIISQITNKYSDVIPYKLTEVDLFEIHNLIEEKYSKWEWNYGYSPKFIFRNQGLLNQKAIEVELEIEKGIINQAVVKVNKDTVIELSTLLQQLRYHEDDVLLKLQSFNKFKATELIKLLF